MTTIQQALDSISLGNYTPNFQKQNINSLQQLVDLSPNDLESIMRNAGMLKGHTFKLRRFIEETKLKGPPPDTHKNTMEVETPQCTQPYNGNAPQLEPQVTAVHKPQSYNGNTHQIDSQLTGVQNQLDNLIQVRNDVMGTLQAIANLDLEQYSRALEELSKLKEMAKAQVSSSDLEMYG
mgnify:FL=1